MKKMKAGVKAKWLKALRSGDYQQINSELHDGGKGYCCLGVLTDIYLKENKLNWGDTYDGEHIYPSDGYLHSPVSEWAGIDSDNPMVVVEEGGRKTQRSLTNLNDGGETFTEIADLIEKEL